MADRVLRMADGRIARIESNPQKHDPSELQW
jgi:hypothetical protein